MGKMIGGTFIVFCLISSVFSQSCGFGFAYSDKLGGCYVLGCTNLQERQLCQKDNCLPGFKYVDPGYCFAEYCKQDFAVECKRCIDGFQLRYAQSSSVTNCSPQNCKIFSDDKTKCSRCKRFNELTKENGCVPENCLSFNEKCVQCEKGFHLDGNNCISDICKKYDSDAQSCRQCMSGYTRDKIDLCVPENTLCIDYNLITGLCGACKKGYRLVGLLTCVQENQLCTQYGFDGCIACIIGFEIRDNICIPKGCKKVNPKNQRQCISCTTGYQLNEQRSCIAKNCDNFNENTWRCNKCLGRYNLQLETGLCKTKNCLLFDHANSLSCIFCEPQYLTINGQCHLLNCQTPKAETCQNCNQGWLMNDNENCVIRNCVLYEGTLCSKCAAGKRLVNGLCIKDICLLRMANEQCLQCENSYVVSLEDPKLCVPYFCSQADQTTGKCKQCFPNFILNSKGFCTNVKCKKFEEKDGFVHSQCVQCENGFRPEDRYCVPNRCEIHNINQNYCEKCYPKYQLRSVPGQLNGPQVCINYNCEEFQESIAPKCLLCTAGFTFDQLLEECLPNNCTRLLQNPEYSESKCQVCEEGFETAFGICLAESCAEFDKRGFCSKCLQGYFLQKNLTCSRILCKKEVIGSCIECEQGYQPILGSCQPLNCQSVLNKLSNNIIIPACGTCQKGYVHYYNYCVAKDCQVFNENYSCKECRKQHQFIDNQCIFKQQFIRYCFKGEYFSPTTFKCEKIQIQFCQHVNKDRPAQCLKCKEGTFLLKGLCYKLENCIEKNYYDGCIQCETGYQKTDIGTCEETFPNCQEYNSQSVCVKCRNGYSLILMPQRRCVQMPKSCALLDVWGRCVGCRDIRMRVRSNRCIYPSDNCLQYHEIHGDCTLCTKGYFYRQNTKKCQKLPDNCLSASSEGICRKCIQPNILNAGKCFNPLQNCDVQSGLKCLKCSSNYYITQAQTCKRVPVNCLLANSNGKCESCRENYYSLDNGKCSKKIQLCYEHNKFKRGCIKCIEGYSPNQSGLFCLFGQ